MGEGFQRQGQQHPLEFSAGEGAQPLVQQSLPVDPGQAGLHPGPQLFGCGKKDRPVGNGGREKVKNAYRVTPVKAGGLGDIADEGPGFVSPGPLEYNFPGVGNLTQYGAEQGAFSRSVWADEGYNLPAVEVEGYIVEYLFLTEVHPQVHDLQAAGAGAAGAGAAVFLYAHPRASARVSTLRCMASR